MTAMNSNDGALRGASFLIVASDERIMDDGGAAGEAACPESDLASLTVARLSRS
jgi:hypothetical protein